MQKNDEKNNKEKSFSKVSINWYNPTKGQPHANPYK
jgi:hypothetical protein